VKPEANKIYHIAITFSVDIVSQAKRIKESTKITQIPNAARILKFCAVLFKKSFLRNLLKSKQCMSELNGLKRY